MDLPLKSSTVEETLDPADWTEMRALSHRIVDDAVDYLRGVRERPVWQDMPEEVKAFFMAALPQTPTPLVRCLRRSHRKRDALSDGQHPSALLVLVHGIEQLRRGAGRLPGGDPGLESRRRQPCRRPDGPAGRGLVQGDDRLSRLGQRHAGQRRLDGQHHRPGRGAQRQGRGRHSRARPCRHGQAVALLWLGSGP